MHTSDIGPHAVVPEWLLFAVHNAMAIRLWCVLARHANVEGCAYPSVRRLALLCRCTEKTVLKALSELEAVGAVVVARGKAQAGTNRMNGYHLVYARKQGVGIQGPEVLENLQHGVGKYTTRGVGKSTTERIIVDDNIYMPDSNGVLDSSAVATAFEQFWAAYPKRAGTNSKSAAWQRFQRLVKSGAALPQRLVAAARAYGAAMARSGKVGTEYVQQATTFLGVRETWREYGGETGGHVVRFTQVTAEHPEGVPMKRLPDGTVVVDDGE